MMRKKRKGVVESNLVSRRGAGAPCENGLHAGEEICAVFDCGNGLRASPSTAGVEAAKRLTGWASTAKSPLDITQAVAEWHDIIAAVAAEHAEPGLDLTAHAAVLDIPQMTAFRVGEAWIRVGEEYDIDGTPNDVIGRWRDLILRSLLIGGSDALWLAANDPTRDRLAQVMHVSLASLRNKDPENYADAPEWQRRLVEELEHGVIDGTATPGRHVDFTDEMEEGDEVVLATVGYPIPAATLEEAEAILQQRLREAGGLMLRGDAWEPARPLGVQDGDSSYADRAYIRVRI